MKVLEKRALARCAAAEYFTHPDNRVPQAVGAMPGWIAKLNYGPDPTHDVYLRLEERDLIVWRNGWRPTAAGWAELRKLGPRKDTP